MEEEKESFPSMLKIDSYTLGRLYEILQMVASNKELGILGCNSKNLSPQIDELIEEKNDLIFKSKIGKASA